ncbi:MAG: hypothetical protein II812_05165, partial [Prevotella sp.]|nr:hypothetical protein [Prevotella sp.]
MEASLVGVLNNGDAPVKLVDPTAPANHAAVRYTTKIYGTDVQVSTTEASVPEHFIEVKDNFMNQSYGYVMNLRGADGDIPALLKDGYTVGSIGIVAPGDVALQGTLKACVDFGSSSSIVRCNIDGGADIPTPIENSCTLRKCLTEYNFNKYKSVINDPENENHKFLSNVSVYDAVNGVGIPVTPYKKAWTPLVKSYRHYPEIGNINSSHKTELTLAGVDAPYPRMIIQTMCYNIACTAINRHCNKVVIVPSLPSEQYKTGLNTAWDSAIAQMHIMFPQLTMEHTLTYNNIHYLYESIAVSLGAGTTGGNNLTISVDIGDGTTDMSAIFYDVGGNVNLCGCSSIEYAGKDLIKTVLKDIVANTTGDIAKKMFEGNLGASAAYGPSVFKPNAGEEDNYLHFVEDIIAAGVGSDNFERLVMDILDISTLNAGVGNNDQKVAANFILRYMILMPVVKDFIHVAIKLAQKLPTPYDPARCSINIYFRGGASQGLNMFNVIDPRPNGARTLLDSYFKNEFGGAYANACNVFPPTPIADDKQTLIKGLTTLNLEAGAVHTLGLSARNEGGNNDDDVVNGLTGDQINPLYAEGYGLDDSVHKNALREPFRVVINEATNEPNTERSGRENRAIRRSGS